MHVNSFTMYALTNIQRYGTVIVLGIVLPAIAVCRGSLAEAQETRNDKGLAFEVSSIKPTKPIDFDPTAPRINGCHGVDTTAADRGGIGLGRCHFDTMSVYGLLAFAYGIGGRQPSEWGRHPAWIEDTWYQIDAIAPKPGSVTHKQLLQMLQSLLRERFALKMHQETKIVSGYAIVVAPGGAKLKRADGPPYASPIHGDIKLRGNLSTFANILTGIVQDRFVDRTGLDGQYDVALKWGGQFKYYAREGPSLSDALQTQLGLKLQREKIQVNVFVIDSASKAAAN